MISRDILIILRGNIMTQANTKSVKMTYSALLSYIVRTHYRSMAGIIGVLISTAALVLLIVKWGDLATERIILYAIIAALFLVVNPAMLAFKAYQQLKLSPSYREPLQYTFSDEGIVVSQGEASEKVSWDKICRVMLTNKILVIYTSRIHAFVLPVSELGDDKTKIYMAIVQFTSEYNPKLSNNLKRYQSGKGM